MKKSDKQLVILAVILVAILAIYFGYLGVKALINKYGKHETVSYKILDNFDPDSVKEIFVEDTIGQKTFELIKINGNWQFKSPLNYITDNQIISSYLTGFQQLYFRDKINADEVSELKYYGLDNPNKTFRFLIEKDGKEYTTGVIFGERTPTMDGLYLKIIDKPEVYVITLDAIQLIDFDAQALRNKNLFTVINKDNVGTIVFTDLKNGCQNQLIKEGGAWKWNANYDEKIKNILVPDESIKSIFDRVFYLSAVDVLDEMPKNPELMYEITLISIDKNTTVKIQIAKKEKSPDDTQELFYAFNSYTKEIFTISILTIKTFFTEKPYLLSELVEKK
ncbi:MAG TPA: DUF4340 domain-containing protein [Exilispira sp.]|nr:DUF4340 domain-containing protein [Exilispira sp.]HQQ18474.1 DUF4340 domain-containing protein [Exilispira sp.]